MRRQTAYGFLEGGRVREQRRDVPEENPRLGKIGNLSDETVEIHGNPCGESVVRGSRCGVGFCKGAARGAKLPSSGPGGEAPGASDYISSGAFMPSRPIPRVRTFRAAATRWSRAWRRFGSARSTWCSFR